MRRYEISVNTTNRCAIVKVRLANDGDGLEMKVRYELVLDGQRRFIKILRDQLVSYIDVNNFFIFDICTTHFVFVFLMRAVSQVASNPALSFLIFQPSDPWVSYSDFIKNECMQGESPVYIS